MSQASADIRNFAVVGHASAGKTMLCESMLVCCGVVHRLGNIAQGTTVSDYHESERQRQISVHASLLHAERMGKKLNILDTPGYLDFISEALGALRVVDFAVVVVKDLATPSSTTTRVGPTPISHPSLFLRYSMALSVIKKRAYPNDWTPA